VNRIFGNWSGMASGSSRTKKRWVLATGLVVVLASCTSTATDSSSGPTPEDSATISPESVDVETVDLTKLPIGDQKFSTSKAKKGYVYLCQELQGNGGASEDVPWIDGDTYDLTAKTNVEGDVDWPDANFKVKLSGKTRTISGNVLPITHTSGLFPVAKDDPAYEYDRNPNSIGSSSYSVEVPADPTLANEPTCTGGGEVGFELDGVPFFNALDNGNRDAVAHEILDSCEGHPDAASRYHHHSLSPCVDDGESGHSSLVGYALDGFGMYGFRGEDGNDLKTSDLDKCHGHTHTIDWDGTETDMYHYHATWEFPYTLGCFRGTSVAETGIADVQGPPAGQGR
jgi:hypothetical protein